MTEKKTHEYEVGYGKPPKHTQFKSGCSGNRSGRPRRSSTLADEIKAEMNSKITASENGKPQRMTKLQAMIKQHAVKAINGSLGSAKLLLEGMQEGSSSERDNLTAILDAFEERNRKLASGPGEEKESSALSEELISKPPDRDQDA